MMDITEYWATLVSIVIGLGVADLLVNLHRLIHDRKRVSWDPLPLLWAVIALAWMLNYWWAVAMNLDGSRSARTAGEFALLAVPPILLFLSSASVLPRAMPVEERLDMKAEWASSRSVFFAIFVLNQLAAWVVVTVARQEFVWDTAATVRTVSMVAAGVLLFVRLRWVEWIGLAVVFAAMSVRLATQQVR